MFTFGPNDHGTIITVFYRGINLGRLKPSKACKRGTYPKTTKFMLIDADQFGLTRGSRQWQYLRTKGFDSQDIAAKWMKEHYIGR